MSEEEILKTDVSEDVSWPFLKYNQHSNKIHSINSQTPCEVFRNDTTAVEVIVKQVKNKSKKVNGFNEKMDVEKLYERVEHLTNEVNKATMNLNEMRDSFKLVMFEMGRQLEAVNQRELKTHTRNLFLLLEKEKLKAISDSKSNLITKLKRELLNMRRIIKLVIKGVRCVSFSSETVISSDSEYTEFEDGLEKDNSMQLTLHRDCVNVTNETKLSDV